jgi:hypothetical protein
MGSSPNRPRAVHLEDGWHVEGEPGYFWTLRDFFHVGDACTGTWEARAGLTDHGWQRLATFTEREAHLIAGALRGPGAWWRTWS